MTMPALPNDGSMFDFGQWMAARRTVLRSGVIEQLRQHDAMTGKQLRIALDAGIRELEHVLEGLRLEGRIVSQRRWWRLAPCAG
jgi:hypothetical protein